MSFHETCRESFGIIETSATPFDAFSVAVVGRLNPRRELIGDLVIGDRHHGDLRFWKAVAPRLGILVDELEIAQVFHRLGDRCRVNEDNGEEPESHGAWTGEYEGPFQTAGRCRRERMKADHWIATSARMQQRAEERLAEARGDGVDASRINGRTCPPNRSSVDGTMSRGEPSPS